MSAADDVDDADVTAQECDRPRRPAEAEGDQDERDAETERVRQSPSRPRATGSPRLHETEKIAVSVGPMQGVHPIPIASPSSGAPIRPTLPRQLRAERALREAEHADEDEPEQDDDDTHDAGDQVAILPEEATAGAAEDRRRS